MKAKFIRMVLASAAFLSCIHADGDSSNSACILPPVPTNGQYKVNRVEKPDPTKAYEFLALNYSCNPGYESLGNTVRLCIKGIWSSDEPKCGRVCKLAKNPSVEYACVVKGKGVRPCKEFEPEGTLARPKCSANYQFCADLPNMHCIDGSWDYFPTCQPVCGIFPNDEHALQPWLTPTGLTRVPWFATVYKKSVDKPYAGWCSATLVTKNAVLTAAHCFWDRQVMKASIAGEFAVAVGKMVRAWNAAEDRNAQKSDVAKIIIHPEYPFTKESQNDIAVVKLVTEVTFGPNVRPACLDFDMSFEQQQLQENAKGLFVSIKGDKPGSDLSVHESVPYVSTKKCLSNFRVEFQKFVTFDKICAGSLTGNGTCRIGLVAHGYSGGGIAFPEDYRGVKRYYLRGIATLTSSFEGCKTNPIGIFTQITKHEDFIKEFI